MPLIYFAFGFLAGACTVPVCQKNLTLTPVANAVGTLQAKLKETVTAGGQVFAALAGVASAPALRLYNPSRPS